MKSVAIEIANNFTKGQGGANICRKKEGSSKNKDDTFTGKNIKNFFKFFQQISAEYLAAINNRFNPISTVTDISGITISNSSRESIVKNMKGEGTTRSIFTIKINTMKSDDGMEDFKRISDFSTSYDYPTKFNLELELKM